MPNVALFITCLNDAFYPRTGIAVVKVLEHLGCHVSFPQDQTCCGQPLWNNGYHDGARELARQMVHAFADAEHVVTPSGSCCAMIREYYADLFKDDEPTLEAARQFAGKTYEFIEYLTRVLQVDPATLNAHWQGSVTYHYSCHLRGLGMTNEATTFLQQIEGLDFRPLEKVDQCCGFGGTFAMKFSDVSGAMVRDKVQCIEHTGADTVVSNDAGCTMNISGACHRQQTPVRFKHIAEILAEGLGLMEPST